MARESSKIVAIRGRLIELLECERFYFRYDVADFILDLLQNGYPFREVELTNEIYKPEFGYVMKRPHGYDIYIKLRIDETVNPEEVHIMSFHPQRP